MKAEEKEKEAIECQASGAAAEDMDEGKADCKADGKDVSHAEHA